MTDAEFDSVYAESKCDGDRDKIIAFLFDQRRILRDTLRDITTNPRVMAILERYSPAVFARLDPETIFERAVEVRPTAVIRAPSGNRPTPP